MTKKRNFFVKIVSNWLDFYQAAWYYSFRPGIASGLKKMKSKQPRTGVVSLLH
jgi:hypothetical protein